MHSTSQTRQISTDYGVITYEITWKNVKNINLRVKSDCTVHISASQDIEIKYIDEFIKRKASYIIKSINAFSDQLRYQPSDKKYISGESISLLGKQLRIRLVQDNNNFIISDGIFLYLHTKNPEDTAQKARCVSKWVKEQCTTIFNEITSDVYDNMFSRYIHEKPDVIVRTMKNRWGSCNINTHTITLNNRLIEMPRYCIEYVITHELTHFIQPNHSKQYYSFLSMIMPDWKQRKQQLEDFLINIKI